MNYLNISVDILAALVLYVTIHLARVNLLVDNEKTRYYLITACTTVAELFLEIIYYIINGVNVEGLESINLILNLLVFILTPFAALCIVLLHSTRLLKYKIWLYVPIGLNAVFLVLTVRYGLVFRITPDNIYVRGPLYYIEIILSVGYLLIAIISDLYIFRKNDNDEYFVLKCLYFLITLGAIFQLTLPMCPILWTSAAFAEVLYYIFLRECEFKFDKLSHARNRSAFIHNMELIKKNGFAGDLWIGVFDINNLKNINDEFGHESGDAAIRSAAEILQQVFEKHGTVYRIGGDEFSVLCKNCTHEEIEDCKNEFKSRLYEYNKTGKIELEIASGYDFCETDNYFDAYNTFSSADSKMYENKRLSKSRRSSR